MLVNLLTDAPKHNLALMKISAWHKAQGDEVHLNGVGQGDISYGSWLYSQERCADVNGGSIFPEIELDPEIESMKPDYTLYNLDYSLGCTHHDCPRSCGFCIVPKQPKTNRHDSIWTFHDARFKKICLLNNNWFSDPLWKETFEEIWDAKLTIRNENGFDIRLLDDEKANAIKKTKFDRAYQHFAWDNINDEKQIVEGLQIAKKFHIRAMVYVLMGYNSSFKNDLYRCQVIHNNGFDPYPMPYNGGTPELRAFKRFICLRMYRKYLTLEKAWEDYNRK